MIVAGLALLAVGTADLMRQFLRGRARWIGYLVCALLLLGVGIAANAVVAAVIAVVVAAAWQLTVPADGSGRAGFWPVAALGALCALTVAFLPIREDQGALGAVWHVTAPFGDLSLDQTVVVVGALAFLLESANVLVRTALRSDRSPTPQAPASGSTPHTLKGGRLIGPLERILVFALTLSGAYSILAAVLAAKGIVRFPEISRDRAAGTQAEYFLVGSLVSWVAGLAAAFLVWWSVAG